MQYYFIHFFSFTGRALKETKEEVKRLQGDKLLESSINIQSGDLENVIEFSSITCATKENKNKSSEPDMATQEMEDIDNFSDTDGSDDADIDLTDISEQHNTSVGSKQQSKDDQIKTEKPNEERSISSKDNDANLVEVSTNCDLFTDDPSKSSKDAEVNENVSTTPIGMDDDNIPEPQISEGETRYYNLHLGIRDNLNSP